MKKFSRYFSKIINIDWRYRLYKKTGHFLYKKQETSGKTLEFIGTSGIGKSTLYRGCMNKLNKRWFFHYQTDLVKRKNPSCEADRILMQILKSRIEKINNSDSFSPWHSLLDLKLSVRVMYDAMLVAHSAHPKGFVFDEGLFRHFPAEILQLGDRFPVQLWKNRAFVYLRARTPETVLSRFKSRSMLLGQENIQRARTDDEHLSRIVKDQEMFQSIVDRALSFGCPVLVIDAENPLQDSIEKVFNFERSLDRTFRMQEKMQKETEAV